MSQSVEAIRHRILELLLKYEPCYHETDECIVQKYANEIIQQLQLESIFDRDIIQLIITYYNVEGYKIMYAQTNNLMKEWKGKYVALLRYLYQKYGIYSEVKLEPVLFKSIYCMDMSHKSKIDNYIVRKCRNKVDKKKYAVHIIRTQEMNVQQRNELEETINNWMYLSNPHHPNIASLHDVFTSDSKTLLIADLCTYTNFKCKSQRKPEHEVKLWFKDILCAIKHIHHKRFIHGNICMGSIVFDHKSSTSPLKLTSFQHAAVSEDTHLDICAAGELLHKLLTGCNVSDTNTSCSWDTVSHEAKDLVRKLLERDPSKYVSATEALQHLWFKEIKVLSSDEMESIHLTLDDVQIEFKQIVGHKPHTKSQLLQFCKSNNFPFKFRDISHWWPSRPDPQQKPLQKPINAEEMQLMQEQIEQKQAQQMIIDSPVAKLNESTDSDAESNETIIVHEVSEDSDDNEQSHYEQNDGVNERNEGIVSIQTQIEDKPRNEKKNTGKESAFWHCCKCMLCCCRSAHDTDYKKLQQNEESSHSINVSVIILKDTKKSNEEQPLIISSERTINYT